MVEGVELRADASEALCDRYDHGGALVLESVVVETLFLFDEALAGGVAERVLPGGATLFAAQVLMPELLFGVAEGEPVSHRSYAAA